MSANVIPLRRDTDEDARYDQDVADRELAEQHEDGGDLAGFEDCDICERAGRVVQTYEYPIVGLDEVTRVESVRICTECALPTVVR